MYRKLGIKVAADAEELPEKPESDEKNDEKTLDMQAAN